MEGKKKKSKRWILLLLVIAAAAAGIALYLKSRNAGAGTQDAYVTEAPSVRTIVKSLKGNGTLKPANSYTVTTLVEGEILTADFEEGDIVEKGTVLYEVDSTDTANNIEMMQLSLNQARRNYNNTVDRRYVKADVSGTVVALNVRVGDKVAQGQSIGIVRDSAVMTLKVPFPSDDAAGFSVGQGATVMLDGSFETLYGTVSEIAGAEAVGAGNMLTRDVTVEVVNPGALTDGQSASVSINGVNAAGNAAFTYRAESGITTLAAGTVESILIPEGGAVSKGQAILTLGGSDFDNQLQSSAESLRSAELSMENSKKQLKNYTITSPITGTIVDKPYKAGDTISGTNKTLCVIYDLSYLEMTLNVDELDISDVTVGQSVQVTGDAVAERAYQGVVTRVSVAGTTANGMTSYPVTIRLDDTDGLLPGMNVDAEIFIRQAENVLSIPGDAVARGDYVLVTEASPAAANAAEKEAPAGYAYVKVTTGVSDDDYVEVTGGLTAADTIAYVPATGETTNLMDVMMNGPGGGPDGGPNS